MLTLSTSHISTPRFAGTIPQIDPAFDQRTIKSDDPEDFTDLGEVAQACDAHADLVASLSAARDKLVQSGHLSVDIAKSLADADVEAMVCEMRKGLDLGFLSLHFPKEQCDLLTAIPLSAWDCVSAHLGRNLDPRQSVQTRASVCPALARGTPSLVQGLKHVDIRNLDLYVAWDAGSIDFTDELIPGVLGAPWAPDLTVIATHEAMSLSDIYVCDGSEVTLQGFTAGTQIAVHYSDGRGNVVRHGVLTVESDPVKGPAEVKPDIDEMACGQFVKAVSALMPSLSPDDLVNIFCLLLEQVDAEDREVLDFSGMNEDFRALLELLPQAAWDGLLSHSAAEDVSYYKLPEGMAGFDTAPQWFSRIAV